MERAELDPRRFVVLSVARSWLGTPWKHAQVARGIGVDCAMFLCSVYYQAGLVPWIDPRPYPPDWFLHRDEERMLNIVKRYAHPVVEPLPGDIALYQWGRCVSHVAIVVDDELVIHAFLQAESVTYTERDALADRLAKPHSYWSAF